MVGILLFDPLANQDTSNRLNPPSSDNLTWFQGGESFPLEKIISQR